MELFPTNGAVASLEAFAAALGCGKRRNFFRSPQRLQSSTHEKRRAGSNYLLGGTFIIGEKRRKRRGEDAPLRPKRNLRNRSAWAARTTRRLFDPPVTRTAGKGQLRFLFFNPLFHIHPCPVMLSRAVLPLTRPNVLASAVRTSALSAQRPRWYAQGKGNTPYTLPESMQPQETKQKKRKPTQKPQAAQHTTEQPEFDTKAQPETDAQPVSYLYRRLIPLSRHEPPFSNLSWPIVRSRRVPSEAPP